MASNPTAWHDLCDGRRRQRAAERPDVVSMPVVAVLPDNQVRVSGKPATGLRAGSMWMAATDGGRAHAVARHLDRRQGRGQYQVIGHRVPRREVRPMSTTAADPAAVVLALSRRPARSPTNITYTRVHLPRRLEACRSSAWSSRGRRRADARVSRLPAGSCRARAAITGSFPHIAGVAQEVPAMRQGQWTSSMLAPSTTLAAAHPRSRSFHPRLASPPSRCRPTALYITPQGGNLTTLIWTPTGEIDVVFYWMKWTGMTERRPGGPRHDVHRPR